MMQGLRTQFFLTYAISGTALPYIGVFFREQGLSEQEVATTFGIASFAIILTPALLSWAADARVSARLLLACVFAVGGAALVGLWASSHAWWIAVFWTLHCLCWMPALPLQDGIFFSGRRMIELQGDIPLAYHQVRVWGTIGFIMPGLLLFVLLQQGMSLAGVMLLAAGVSAMAMLQALRLPAVMTDRVRPPGAVPLVKALQLLLGTRLVVFVIAAFLMHMGSAALYAFYPIYLTERIGIAPKWIGMISNIGVVVEVFFVLGAGWLIRLLGLKKLLLLGAGATVIRMGLLASFENTAVAIGTQLAHGLQVLVMMILPPQLIDRYADERCRHSVQGVYTMTMGIARAFGSFLAGPVAAWSLAGVFGWAAALAAGGFFVLLFLFREREG